MRALFVSMSILTLAAAVNAQVVCGTCKLEYPPRTLLDSYFEAPIVVIGRLQNAVPPDNALPDGRVELVLDDMVVPHAVLKGRKSIVLPRHRDASPQKLLVAVDIHKGQLDPYLGTPLDAQGEVERYVRGAFQLKDRSTLSRMRYSAAFLSSRNADVAASAHLEVLRGSDAEIRKIAEELRPDPLAAALRDSATPSVRLGTFARLLGYCGNKEHAATVRKLLDDPERAQHGRSDLIACYILLEPEIGWKFALAAATNREAVFLVRYGAFRAMRTVACERKDLVGLKKYGEAMVRLLQDAELADFGIEEMRKQKLWTHCDAVLDLSGKEGFTAPIMRRAILRYSLQCPNQRAQAFVTEQRNADAEFVAEVEELLALEMKDLNPRKK